MLQVLNFFSKLSIKSSILTYGCDGLLLQGNFNKFSEIRFDCFLALHGIFMLTLKRIHRLRIHRLRIHRLRIGWHSAK